MFADAFYNSGNYIVHAHNYRDFNASLSRPDPYGQNAFSRFYEPIGVNYTQWHYAKIVWTPQGDGRWITRWYVK